MKFEYGPGEIPVHAGPGSCDGWIYLPVKGFVGYWACELGTIWSCWSNRYATPEKKGGTMRWHRLKLTQIKGEYLTVSVARFGAEQANELVHKLVMLAFGTWRNAPHTRHIDGNPANNRPENLIGGTAKENAADKWLHGTMPTGEMCGNSVLTEATVVAIRADRAAGMMFRDIAAKHGIKHHSMMMSAIYGDTWKHVPGAIPKVQGGARYNVARGSASPVAKLTESDVVGMRSDYRSCLAISEIAAKHKISGATAHRAIIGKTWSHVPGAVASEDRRNSRTNHSRNKNDQTSQ